MDMRGRSRQPSHSPSITPPPPKFLLDVPGPRRSSHILLNAHPLPSATTLHADPHHPTDPRDTLGLTCAVNLFPRQSWPLSLGLFVVPDSGPGQRLPLFELLIQ